MAGSLAHVSRSPSQQRQQQRKKASTFARPRDSRSPATPKTLERSTSHKESLANLFADLNIIPAPFYARKVKSGQKDWKVRAAALQSARIRRLSQSLVQRRKSMKSFASNGMFVDIFKRVPRSKEDEEQRQMLETALTSSPVELVARELIDKTANIQHRERHGVWSQLGKPYTCLGVPASALSKDCPMPKETRTSVDDEDDSLPFFPSASKSIPAHVLVENMERPISGTETELGLNFPQDGFNMQWLLRQMGVSHLHDMGPVRFPRQPLEDVEHLRKSLKVSTIFSEDLSEKMLTSHGKGLPTQQSISLPDFR